MIPWHASWLGRPPTLPLGLPTRTPGVSRRSFSSPLRPLGPTAGGTLFGKTPTRRGPCDKTTTLADKCRRFVTSGRRVHGVGVRLTDHQIPLCQDHLGLGPDPAVPDPRARPPGDPGTRDEDRLPEGVLLLRTTTRLAGPTGRGDSHRLEAQPRRHPPRGGTARGRDLRGIPARRRTVAARRTVKGTLDPTAFLVHLDELQEHRPRDDRGDRRDRGGRGDQVPPKGPGIPSGASDGSSGIGGMVIGPRRSASLTGIGSVPHMRWGVVWSALLR